MWAQLLQSSLFVFVTTNLFQFFPTLYVLSIPKNHEYREEETVRARDSMTVVAALQHYHGGWNDMMKAVSVMPECFLSIIKEKSKIELFGELLIYIFCKKGSYWFFIFLYLLFIN